MGAWGSKMGDGYYGGFHSNSYRLSVNCYQGKWSCCPVVRGLVALSPYSRLLRSSSDTMSVSEAAASSFSETEAMSMLVRRNALILRENAAWLAFEPAASAT